MKGRDRVSQRLTLGSGEVECELVVGRNQVERTYRNTKGAADADLICRCS